MGSSDSPRRPEGAAAGAALASLEQTGERYALIRALGRGGMAFVYEATEVATGRRLALKRLQPHPDRETYQRNAQLFEREYYALSQLAHPRVVEVFDSGIDETGPYYTMELLDSGVLEQLAPLPWRTACAFARDICSALSFLHARRLLLRDVSPRNVRISHAGLAKLFDFGALAPFGPSKRSAGPLPCCAPESVSLQNLDGRSDLFALGATLYFMLARRHAYAARHFSELSDVWRAGFAPLSALLPGIPPALDALVRELLLLQPDARPAHAAEVIERLCAIEGRSPSEQPGVARGQLARPALVGRERQLAWLRLKFARARNGATASVVVEGGSGVGRSRLIDAALLEATLLGASVLRADADDAIRGEYGALRALARQLLAAMPAEARESAGPGLPTLQQFIPELEDPAAATPLPSEVSASSPHGTASAVQWQPAAPTPPSERRDNTAHSHARVASAAHWQPAAAPAASERRDSASHWYPSFAAAEQAREPVPMPALTPLAESAARPQLLAAIRTWFRTLARDRPLVLAVDDFQRIDESSATLLALLADDLPAGLCVLCSVESGAQSVSPRSLKLLLDASSHLRLEHLSWGESERLLRSLFGELRNGGTLGKRLFELSAGNPRDLLRSAQHLVERRAIRLEGGSWLLGRPPDPADLPNSLSQMLRARLETFGASGRQLACALALCADRGFSFEECGSLCERGEPAALLSDLDQLVRAECVRSVDDQFLVSQPHWSALLRSYLTPELERTLQARLARVLERRGDAFRAGQHWLRAGEHTRALDVLVAHAAKGEAHTIQTAESAARYVRSLPPDWFETFDQAIRLCEELRRPKRDAFVLRMRLAGLVPASATRDTRHVDTLLVELERYSGLNDWHALDSGLDPMVRVRCALQRAEQRFAASPEDGRVIPPKAALGRLSRATSAALHRVVVGIDIRYLRSWPALQPLAAVSPALAVMSRLVFGIEARYTGQIERARAIYLELLERLERPDRAGLDPTYAELTSLGLLNGLGAIDACMGLSSSLSWAERIASHPAYTAYALQTTALYHLFQGDVQSADQSSRQADRLRLLTLQQSESSHLLWEISAHTIAEDLTRIRNANEQAAVLARTYRAWIAVHHFASAEYERVRRDGAQALRKIELALQIATPDSHALWASMASTHVRTLHDLARYDEALSSAEAYATAARQWELGLSAVPLWLALSLCQAQAGQEVAAQTADDVIERLQAQRVEGLHLGLAYEMRARVALLQKDELGFARYAELCREVYCRHKNPALLAKYKRLRQEAQGNPEVAETWPANPDSYAIYTDTRVVAALEDCKGLEQRAQLALTILARQSGAKGGMLFTLGADGLRSIGAVGEIQVEPRMRDRVSEFFASQLEHAAEGTLPDTSRVPETAEAKVWVEDDGQRYRPVLLSHKADGNVAAIGVALLALSKEAPFKYPDRVASTISRFWSESSDSSRDSDAD